MARGSGLGALAAACRKHRPEAISTGSATLMPAASQTFAPRFNHRGLESIFQGLEPITGD
eukprot:1012555-Prorocentrum_minimum.AAC.1